VLLRLGMPSRILLWGRFTQYCASRAEAAFDDDPPSMDCLANLPELLLFLFLVRLAQPFPAALLPLLK